MAKASGPPPILFILLFLILGGAGYWYFSQPKNSPQTTNQTTETTNQTTGTIPGTMPPPAQNSATLPPPAQNSATFPFPTSVPPGTTVRIDGSTSMVTINQNLKRGFESLFPGSSVVAIANGTDRGIQALTTNTADIAAISRPLTSAEQSQGLVAVAVARDQIAIVVGKDNSYRRGLTSAQVMQIFQGQITDWSQVGGSPGAIAVINRPAISGTHQTFKELVLQGGNFGTTANITTMAQDATTPLLRQLGTNGIGYATYAQVANQQTVRVVPVDGLTPEAATYPYQRQLYYAYKSPPSPQVQYFLGYATSPQGQQAMLAEN